MASTVAMGRHPRTKRKRGSSDGKLEVQNEGRAKSPKNEGTNMKQTCATDNSSMKLSARTPLRLTPVEEGVLPAGERVYAAWKKTSCYYPAVVQSHKTQDTCGPASLVYCVVFDDGDRGDVDASRVIQREKYLEGQLKPSFSIGDEVYAAWWEEAKSDPTTLQSTWYPGVIQGKKEARYGGRLGPIYFYDVL